VRPKQVEGQCSDLLPNLTPDRLGKARRPERVAAVQDRRDRSLTQHLEVFDPQGDFAETPQSRGVLEHGPIVDLDIGEVGCQVR
jgi:hypothetical protein